MTLFERLKGTDNKVKRCIAFLLFLMILLTSSIIPVKRAKAIAPVLVGVGIVALVTAGLVACGIAVNAYDDGSDASTALGYTMQYVRQKMREAKVTELEAGLMVATGAINLASQAWQWIKQAAAHIYNNASYFQGVSNSVQFGNVYDKSIAFCSGDFCISTYSDGFYLFPFSESVYKNRDDVFVLKDVICFSAYDSSTTSLANETVAIICSSPPLNYDFKKGSLVARNCSKYIFNGITYYVSYAHLNLPCNRFYYNYPASTDYKSFADYYSNLFASRYDGTYFDGVNDAGVQMYFNYLSGDSFNTGISAQTSQSASVAFDGAKDYFDGVKDAVTGGSVSADLSTDQQRRLMLGYDVESSKDLINVGQIVQEYGSVSNWLAGIRAGTANAYQDLINIGCQPYVNVDAQGKLVTVDKDGYIIDSTGTRVGTGTGIKVGDGSIAGNPAIPVGDVVSVPLDDVGSIPKVKTDTATGDITVDIDKTLDIPASDTIDKPTPESGNKKYQFAGVTDFFPFCLPFDAYDFLSTFSASPVAPEFEFPASFYTDIFGGKNPEGKHYQVNGKNLVAINGDKVIISLAPFDTIAKIFRVLVLLFFIMMLIWFAYRLIHGGD